MANQLSVYSLLLVLLISTVYVSSNSIDNIMSCMFCESITEAFDQERSPVGVMHNMLKRCNRMGLMEPVCENFISTNVKRVFLLAKTGTPAEQICEKLHLCDDTR